MNRIVIVLVLCLSLGCVAKFGDRTVLGVGNVEVRKTATTETVRGAHIGEVFASMISSMAAITGAVFGGGRVATDSAGVPYHEHDTDEGEE